MERVYTVSFTRAAIFYVFSMFSLSCVFGYFLVSANQEIAELKNNVVSLQKTVSEMNNMLLSQQDMLEKSMYSNAFSNSVVSNTVYSDEYKMFLIQIICIILAIIFLTALIYWMSSSFSVWIAKSFLGKLIATTNSFGLKLLSYLGVSGIKKYAFLIN